VRLLHYKKVELGGHWQADAASRAIDHGELSVMSLFRSASPGPWPALSVVKCLPSCLAWLELLPSHAWGCMVLDQTMHTGLRESNHCYSIYVDQEIMHECCWAGNCKRRLHVAVYLQTLRICVSKFWKPESKFYV
jgi:hypothetical protein